MPSLLTPGNGTPDLVSSSSTASSKEGLYLHHPLSSFESLVNRSSNDLCPISPVSPGGTDIEATPFKMDGSEWVMSPLQFLLDSRPTISGYFDKLFSTNAGAPPQWKPRFFVFDLEDGSLWLFKSDQTTTISPMTSLPVTSVYGYSEGKTYFLQFSGKGVSKEGTVSPKTWTLRCNDELIHETWLATAKSTLARYVELKAPIDEIKKPELMRSSSVAASRRSGRNRWLPSSSIRSRNSSVSRTDFDQEELNREFAALQFKPQPQTSATGETSKKQKIGRLSKLAKFFGF